MSTPAAQLTCFCGPNSNLVIKNNLIATGPPVVYVPNRYSRNNPLPVCAGGVSQITRKLQAATKPPGFTGMSQKMAYGLYSRTTPGLSTFANKKVENKAVPRTFVNQANCMSMGIARPCALNPQISNIHSSVQQKMNCVNNRVCKVSDSTPLRPFRTLPTSMIYR
jgi:hypothetical protein